MAKDAKIQAIENAIAAGTLRSGASTFKGSYSPMPPIENIDIAHDGISYEEVLKHLKVEGLLEPNKMLIVTLEQFYNETLERYYAEYLGIVYNGTEQVESVTGVVSAEKVEGITTIYGKIGVTARQLSIIPLYNGEQILLRQMTFDVDRSNAYAFPVQDYDAKINYKNLPLTITVNLPSPYEVEGWYHTDIAPEYLLGRSNTLTITEDYYPLLLTLKTVN